MRGAQCGLCMLSYRPYVCHLAIGSRARARIASGHARSQDLPTGTTPTRAYRRPRTHAGAPFSPAAPGRPPAGTRAAAAAALARHHRRAHHGARSAHRLRVHRPCRDLARAELPHPRAHPPRGRRAPSALGYAGGARAAPELPGRPCGASPRAPRRVAALPPRQEAVRPSHPHSMPSRHILAGPLRDVEHWCTRLRGKQGTPAQEGEVLDAQRARALQSEL